MKKLLRALKQWTLLIAIVVGAVGHSFFSQFTWLAPWLLASMLLLTFCNISPRDLRFHPLHLILMSLQIVMSLGLYALTLPWHPAIAQGVCMAALTPTATAAAIITGMLGGSVAFLAAYAFLSNLAIVVLAPLVLPLIATGQIDTPFLETMSNVFMRVGPTMLFPLLAAWLIQYAAPKVNAVLLRWGILAYYLWAGMLVILMGGTFEQLLKPGEKDYQLEIFLALTGIAVCTANFILGKSIGSRFHRRIAGGQALAQKNIILPMWLTFQYLDPIASVSLAAYSIFQNIVNAAQIWLKGRRDDRIIQRLHDFHEKKHARIQAAQQLVPQEEHAELLSELPTRVKDRLKKNALGLSGGQQQRLCIARALAVEPDVLLMDEPTSALDPISTSKIEELAAQLKEKYTIVIVTHNMQQAVRISDSTAFFLLGELIEYSGTEHIFSQPEDKRTEDYITGRFG